MRSTVTCHRYLQNLGTECTALAGAKSARRRAHALPQRLSRRPGVDAPAHPGPGTPSGWFLRVAGESPPPRGNASLAWRSRRRSGSREKLPRPVSPFPLLTKHGAAPPRPGSLLRGHPSTEFQGTTRLEGRQFLELREPQPLAARRRRPGIALLPPAPRPRGAALTSPAGKWTVQPVTSLLWIWARNRAPVHGHTG